MTDPFASPSQAPGGFDPSSQASGAEEVDVDFSGTSDDFVPLEDGWYLFSVESATARDDNGGPLLSAGGNPMIKWVARVVEGPRQNSPMFLYTVTNGPGAFSLRRFVNHAFGANLGKEPMRLALGPFIGKKYWGQIGAQKNDASFKEYKNFRPENDPPPKTNAEPVGIAGKI
jgi:hypothetical protein